MVSHLLRNLRLAPMAQILRNASGTKRMAVDSRLHSCCRRTPADHAADIRLAHRPLAEPSRPPFDGRKHVALGIRPEIGGFDVLAKVGIELVMTGHLVTFSALLVQTHPAAISPLIAFRFSSLHLNLAVEFNLIQFPRLRPAFRRHPTVIPAPPHLKMLCVFR